MSTLPITKEALKARILAGESYYAIAKEVGADRFRLMDMLHGDPDIANARRDGVLRPSHNKKTRDDYLALPYVQAVLVHGMSQVEAAERYGVKQPQVSRFIAKALEGRTRAEVLGLPPPPEPAGCKTPTPAAPSLDLSKTWGPQTPPFASPPSTPPTSAQPIDAVDKEADDIVGAILLLAARRGISTRAALQIVIQRLPDTLK